MSGKRVKQMRKQAQKAAKARDEQILPELKQWLNSLPFRDRLKCAWLILLGRF